jgi:dTDP-6-deoxy-L-talose 4-dehydrogenase (NAD+)
MKKILVTGANGYIGHHVVSYLCDTYPQDVVLAVDFNNAKIDPRAQFLNVNLLEKADDSDLYETLNQPDICIHLAWQDGFNHKADSHLKNVSAHFHFLRNLIDAGCRSVSVMGTMHEIGYYEGEVNANTPCNPLSMYGIAKNALRQAIMSYCEDKDVSLKWLRAYYITGDDKNNKSVFAKILEMAAEGKKTFPFTSGLNKYDFIDVHDLAQCISEAAVQTETNGIINVCSGKAVSLKDKVEEFIAQKGLDIRPEYGVYPSRKYDSPAIWGNADLINGIMENKKVE